MVNSLTLSTKMVICKQFYMTCDYQRNFLIVLLSLHSLKFFIMTHRMSCASQEIVFICCSRCCLFPSLFLYICICVSLPLSFSPLLSFSICFSHFNFFSFSISHFPCFFSLSFSFVSLSVSSLLVTINSSLQT